LIRFSELISGSLEALEDAVRRLDETSFVSARRSTTTGLGRAVLARLGFCGADESWFLAVLGGNGVLASPSTTAMRAGRRVAGPLGTETSLLACFRLLGADSLEPSAAMAGPAMQAIAAAADSTFFHIFTAPLKAAAPDR